MDQRQINRALDNRMGAIRAIATGFSAGLLLYVVAAWYAIEQLTQGPLLEVPVALAVAIAASQMLVILCGYLLSRSMRQRARNTTRDAAPEDKAEALLEVYTKSLVVGAGLRDVAGIGGLMLSLVTGDVRWAIGVATMSMISMTVHWPRRAAVDDFLLQQTR